MTGEVENILKGSVVTTVEYDTGRRLIGVSTANLIPGPNGVAPLSKQGAFQVPEKTEVTETVDFVQAISNAQNAEDAIVETVDLPMLDQQNAIKEPVHSDVITENPVQVENPSAMSSFDLPKIEMPTNVTPTEEVAPVAIEIQMPEMTDAVVADEPTGLNEQLFEGAAPVEETTAAVEAAPIVEEVPIVVEVASEVVEDEPVAPTIDIQLPVIEANNNAEVIEQNNIEKEIEVNNNENIMEAIPSTTPDTTIPTFNIEMPVINAVEEVAPEVVEETPVAEVVPVESPTPVEEVVENVVPEVTVTEPQPVEEPALKVEVSEEVTPEVVEETPVEEVAVQQDASAELPQEETEKQTEETPEQKEENGIKDIIHQHRVIIQD